MDPREFEFKSTKPFVPLPGERWLPLPGYEETYKVSTHGRVWSRPRRHTQGGVLTVRTGMRGYTLVSLVQEGRQKTREVHRLVAAAFLGPRPEGMEVRHLDGDKQNPHVSNLAYGTPSENARDKRRHGTDYNVAKTHCRNGHPYDEANTYRVASKPNTRICRTCRRVWSKR
ncbi:NUMOD4 motif-containing HNH endonuclease [Phytomonospora sp. NPDC050363]|uniref:NUMOD4 motif-containing HNH endonuclease n=1 Tax=Phytomonospora sp. NPDC050363 TaxID=3155642 RepID=UPI00340DCB48